MSKVRVEKDSFGNIDVPGEHYWGAQTERSRGNFKIGEFLIHVPSHFGFPQPQYGRMVPVSVYRGVATGVEST